MYKLLIMKNLSQGERLRKVRKELDLSGNMFVMPFDYSASYLYQIEKTVNIPVNIIEDVSREYNVNIDYLKYGIGEMFKGEIPRNSIDYRKEILDELKKQTELLEKIANK